MIKPIGVTTKKNIIPIIIGEKNFPNNKPNLNQSLFNGVKIRELINPKNKNKMAINKDHSLISSSLIKG